MDIKQQEQQGMDGSGSLDSSPSSDGKPSSNQHKKTFPFSARPPIFHPCLCGFDRCIELRKEFYEQEDPLGRYAVYSVSFKSGEEGAGTSPDSKDSKDSKDKKSKQKGTTADKTKKRKAAFEKCFDRTIEYDSKANYVAALHFPIEHLDYCKRVNEKPYLFLKKTEMLVSNGNDENAEHIYDSDNEVIREDMKWLKNYDVEKYRSEDCKGNPIILVPPEVSIREVDYACKAGRAIRKPHPEAVESLQRRGADVPGDGIVGGPRQAPEMVAGAPHQPPDAVDSNGQAVGAGPAVAHQENRQEQGVASNNPQGGLAMLPEGAPLVPPANIGLGMAVAAQFDRANAPVLQGAPGLVPAAMAQESSPASVSTASAGPRKSGRRSGKRFHLQSWEDLNPTPEYPRFGKFELIFSEWINETATSHPALTATKEKFRDDAVVELGRFKAILDEKPPPLPDPPGITHYSQATRDEHKKFCQKRMSMHWDLMVHVANGIGNGFIDLFNYMNPGDESSKDGGKKRRLDPSDDANNVQTGGKGQDLGSEDTDADTGNGPGRYYIGQDRPNKFRKLALVPKEIHFGLLSSLNLSRQDGAKREPRAGDDSSIDTTLCVVETEGGSWARSVNGGDNPSASNGPCLGLEMLANACSTLPTVMGFYNKVLSLGTPEEVESENFATELAWAESNKQVEVVSYDNIDVETSESAFLLKSKDPSQAYRPIQKAVQRLAGDLSEFGERHQALVLPRMHKVEDRLVFWAPHEADAKYVTIKKINKKALRSYLDSGGQEDPYKEIALMKEMGDDVHVLKLIEALEDEHHIYIVTAYHTDNSLFDNVTPGLGCEDEKARAWFHKILEILAHLEKHGIYHSALTPDNFVLVENSLVLVRLGLALLIPQSQGEGPFKVPPGPLGALSFQAPEVYSKGMIKDSASANLWSASVTLYYILTGKTPFSFPHPMDPGFKVLLAKGSLYNMAEFLKSVAADQGVPEEFCVSYVRPGAMKLVSNLLKFKLAERWSRVEAQSSQWLRGEQDIDSDTNETGQANSLSASPTTHDVEMETSQGRLPGKDDADDVGVAAGAGPNYGAEVVQRDPEDVLLARLIGGVKSDPPGHLRVMHQGEKGDQSNRVELSEKKTREKITQCLSGRGPKPAQQPSIGAMPPPPLMHQFGQQRPMSEEEAWIVQRQLFLQQQMRQQHVNMQIEAQMQRNILHPAVAAGTTWPGAAMGPAQATKGPLPELCTQLVHNSTRYGQRSIEIWKGDVTNPVRPVDILVISCCDEDYNITCFNSVIRSVKERHNISVASEFDQCEFDFRENLDVWISRPLPGNVPFRRLLCVSIKEADTKEGIRHPIHPLAQVYSKIFRGIAQMDSQTSFMGARSISIPMVGEAFYGTLTVADHLLCAAQKAMEENRSCGKILVYGYQDKQALVLKETAESRFHAPATTHSLALNELPKSRFPAAVVHEVQRPRVTGTTGPRVSAFAIKQAQLGMAAPKLPVRKQRPPPSFAAYKPAADRDADWKAKVSSIAPIAKKHTHAAKDKTTPITKPRDMDILFGRGGLSNNHPGNQHYNKVLEKCAWDYLHLTGRKNKTQFAWEVVRQLKEEGCRFLRKEKDYYLEADDDDTRKKVSQRLRDLALSARDQMTREQGAEEEEEEVVDSSPQPGNLPTIHAQASFFPFLQVFVKTATGKTIVVNTQPMDTIAVVKIKIEVKERIPRNAQCLTFGGKELDDGRTLSFYNIGRNATLDLSLRVSGGGGGGLQP